MLIYFSPLSTHYTSMSGTLHVHTDEDTEHVVNFTGGQIFQVQI